MQQKNQPTVPREFAGKWIAWDADMLGIVASGDSPAEVLEAAKQAGETNLVLDKSPPANVRLVGGPRLKQR